MVQVMQIVRSHSSDEDGDGERLYVTRKLLGPTGRMQKDQAETFMMNCKCQVTRKPLGPTGRMEMENGSTGTHDT